jgi:hypothetical protein
VKEQAERVEGQSLWRLLWQLQQLPLLLSSDWRLRYCDNSNSIMALGFDIWKRGCEPLSCPISCHLIFSNWCAAFKAHSSVLVMEDC